MRGRDSAAALVLNYIPLFTGEPPAAPSLPSPLGPLTGYGLVGDPGGAYNNRAVGLFYVCMMYIDNKAESSEDKTNI